MKEPRYYIDVKSDGTWLIIETETASAMICLEQTTHGSIARKAIQILGDYLLQKGKS